MKPRQIPPLLQALVRSPLVHFCVRTVMQWQQAECLELGAALSYYALFSLFPIFLVIWSIVAKVAPAIICHNAFGNLLVTYCSELDPSQALLQFAKNTIPSEEAYRLVEGTFTQLQQDSISAGIIGFVLLFFSASNVFAALDRSVQKIWRIHRKRQGNQNVISTILQFILDKILAFALVLGTAALITISFLSKIAIGVLEKLLKRVDSRISFIQIEDLDLISGIQLGATICILMLVVMILFKSLPATRLRWRDALPGAIFTVFLFLILQHLVSLGIISIGSRFKSYGVIGGVMVLMFWIYLTCQIFFIGNAITYVYTHRYGSLRGDVHRTLGTGS